MQIDDTAKAGSIKRKAMTRDIMLAEEPTYYFMAVDEPARPASFPCSVAGARFNGLALAPTLAGAPIENAGRRSADRVSATALHVTRP